MTTARLAARHRMWPRAWPHVTARAVPQGSGPPSAHDLIRTQAAPRRGDHATGSSPRSAEHPGRRRSRAR